VDEAAMGGGSREQRKHDGARIARRGALQAAERKEPTWAGNRTLRGTW
jgi:hypothetical protein